MTRQTVGGQNRPRQGWIGWACSLLSICALVGAAQSPEPAPEPAPPPPLVGEIPGPEPADDNERDWDDATLLAAARIAYRDGDYPKAIRLFSEWCRRAPTAGGRQYELGRAQYRGGLFVAAADSFARAEAAGFAAEHLSLWTGYAAFKLDRWQATANALSRIPEAQMQPEARLKRAIAWFHLRDPRAAMQFELLAIAETPVGFAARYYRGLCFENVGQPGSAFDVYRELQMQAAPFGPAALARLRALQPSIWAVRVDLATGYDSRPSRANDDGNPAGAAPDGFSQIDFSLAVRPLYNVGSISPAIYWLSVFGHHHLFYRNHDLDDSSLGLMQALESSPERFFNFHIEQGWRRYWLGSAPYFDEINLSGTAQWRWRQPIHTHLAGVSVSGDWTHAVGDDFRPYQGLSGSLFGSYAWVYTPGPDWTVTMPVYLGGRLRQAHDVAEDYRQFSGQVGTSVAWMQRLLWAGTLGRDERRYGVDSSLGGQRRREWPTTVSISLEAPLWPHSSIQANAQWIEQGANQAAYRYSNRQYWISLYFWY